MLPITLKGIRRKTRGKKETKKRKIIRMPFAIDPASNNEVLTYKSGESDVKD